MKSQASMKKKKKKTIKSLLLATINGIFDILILQTLGYITYMMSANHNVVVVNKWLSKGILIILLVTLCPEKLDISKIV
jgi:hypothetical protein